MAAPKAAAGSSRLLHLLPALTRTLDLLGVDLLEGEVHAAGGDRGRREEVIRGVREDVDPRHQLIGLGLWQRHRDRTRYRLAHEQAECRAH